MIETTYALTEVAFTEAQKLWCPQAVRKLPGHWLLQGILIAFATLVIFSVPYLPFWMAIAFSLCLLSFAALTFWRKKVLRRVQYEWMRDGVTDISLQLDEEGYRDHKQGLGSCLIAWSRFTGWREGPHVFILGLNLQFITIPKSALSQAQQNELRALLQTSIKPH